MNCSLMVWVSNELHILKKGRQIKALKVTLEARGTITRLSSSWAIRKKATFSCDLRKNKVSIRERR